MTSVKEKRQEFKCDTKQKNFNPKRKMKIFHPELEIQDVLLPSTQTQGLDVGPNCHVLMLTFPVTYIFIRNL